MTKLTTEIFKSYLQCKYKIALKISNQIGDKSDYENMQFERSLEFKKNAISKCFSSLDRVNATLILLNKHGNFSSDWRKFFVNVEIEDGDIHLHCDALERVSGKSNLGHFHYVPILLVENDKLSKDDLPLFSGLIKIRFFRRSINCSINSRKVF